MLALTCPECKTLGSFVPVWNEPSVPPRYRLLTQHGSVHTYVLRCPNVGCQMLVAGVTLNGELAVHWPETVGGKDFPDVPEHIASAADEAHRCASIGAFRGAVALARAVVEATAKHYGITKGNLMSNIDDLAKAQVISEAMKDAAHEIRFAGNEVAHGDLAEEPLGAEDASEVLELMDAILTRVFQEPAHVARVRNKREARKSGSVQGEIVVEVGP